MGIIHYPRRYFIFLAVISIVAGFICYIYFQNQPKVYKSSGKFSVHYSGGENLDEKSVYTSNYNLNLQAEARSLIQGIKSRVFVSSLLESARIKYNPEILNKIDKIISAEMIDDSNIITVEIYSDDQSDLNKINNKFLEVINSPHFATSQDPKIQIKTVDPLYLLDKPIYPESTKYSLLVSGCLFLLGCMLYFIFQSQKEQELYNTYNRNRN